MEASLLLTVGATVPPVMTRRSVSTNLDFLLVDPAGGDLRPQQDSPLLGAGSAPEDPFFDRAHYIGAFSGPDDDWAEGWTVF